MLQYSDETAVITDRQAIAHVVSMWTYYRDRHLWEPLRTTFHPEGTISSLWFDGPFETFVAASCKMAQKGDTGKHLMGIPYIRLNADRALSETDVTILVRQQAGSLELDLTSYVRFFDRFQKRDGQWKILNRTVIYEKDRLDPVQPSLRFWLLGLISRAKRRPAAFRYLGYGLERRGVPLVPTAVITGSEASQKLYRASDEWFNHA